MDPWIYIITIALVMLCAHLEHFNSKNYRLRWVMNHKTNNQNISVVWMPRVSQALRILASPMERDKKFRALLIIYSHICIEFKSLVEKKLL